MNNKNLSEIFKGFKDGFQNWLTIFILVVCFTIFIIIIFGKYKENPHVAEIRTYVGNVILIVIGYHFGSSRGSANKEKIIGNLTETKE